MSRIPLLLAAALTLLVRPGSSAGSTLDYFYVEPNGGTASGGHVALRLDDRVFHFQNGPGNTVRLHRDDYDHFRYLYTVLENRTIHVARIPVTPETHQRLRDRFTDRYFIEGKYFSVAEDLASDVALLERLLDESRGDDGASEALPAAGLLYRDGEAPGTAALDAARGNRSAPVDDLRRRVEARHGPGFLPNRRAAISGAMGALEPRAQAPPAVTMDGSYPVAAGGPGRRYQELALQLLAVDALLEGRGLGHQARIAPVGDDFRLTPTELAVLDAFADDLATSLVDLTASTRPDWGFALLVGMSRLDALAATLTTGHHVFVDAFPAGAALAPVPADGDRRTFLEELRDRARRNYTRARRHGLADNRPMTEADFAALEEAANRYAELTRGLALGTPIRLSADRLLPSAPATIVGLPVPVAADGIDLRQALALTRAAEAAYGRALAETFGYDLLRRNCVSQIFATIDDALGEAGSVAELGGYIDPRHGLNFIPAVSFRAVTGTYAVSHVGEIASYRRTRLQAMYDEHENPLAVYFREATTLTSTVYRQNGDEPFFLFFTDDLLLPRPLFGSFNVLAGLGEALVGVVKAPLDGGRTLWSGMIGTAFSIPELAFVNLRKGRLTYARRDAPRTTLRLARAHD